MRNLAKGGCCIVALALIFVGGCRREKDEQANNLNREITVTGTGEVMVVPDMATVAAGVVTLNKDAKKSQAQNNEIVAKILALTKAMGIADKDVNTGQVSLGPKEERTDNGTTVFLGYEANKTVTIVLHDVSKYDQLVTGLLEAGCNRIQAVSLGSSKEAEEMHQARGIAVEAARDEAKFLVGKLGEKLGRAFEIRDVEVRQTSSCLWGGGGGGAGGAGASYGGSEVTVAPGTKVIAASVVVSFQLEDEKSK